jgi:hypothetical protein
MQTIELAQVLEISGVNGTKEWKSGNMIRHYIQISDCASKVWWEADGKVRFEIGRGRSSSEANATLEAIIGCNLSDRYSKKAEYVILK